MKRPIASARRRALLLVAVVVAVGLFPSMHRASARYATGLSNQKKRDRPIVLDVLGVGGPKSSFRSYLFNVDGHTGERGRQLSDKPGREPRWSPNGRRIAYGKGFEDKLEIWVVRRDGTHRRRITDNDSLDQWPSWAPGSRRVVVERWTGDEPYNNELVIVKADGSNERNLSKSKADEVCPDWSPDGRRIAFSRYQTDDIYTIRPNGTRLRHLTSGMSRDGGPKWSPDGRKILFYRITTETEQSGPMGLQSEETEQKDLYVMNRKGFRMRRLTDTPPSEGAYAWSPDGSKIAFIASDGRDRALWVMNADGSEELQLVTGAVGAPTWSRDGKTIIYPRVREGDRYGDIWVIDADGSRNRKLTTTDDVHEDSPNWYSTPQTCGGAY